MSARLERSRTNRVIGGVCGGIGEYLQIDPLLVRVAFVILAFPFGVGLLAYIVLLVLMPHPGEPAPFVRPAPPAGPAPGSPGDAAALVTGTGDSVVRPEPASADVVDRRRNAIGLLLVGVGVIFLLGNIGALRFIDMRYIWPLVVIALGVFLLIGRTRR